MVKKRLQDNKEEDEGEDKTGDNKSKLAGKTSSLVGKHYFVLEKKFKQTNNYLFIKIIKMLSWILANP